MSIDGVEMDAAAFGVAIPIDPGRRIVMAKAPNKKTWSVELDVPSKKKALSVDIPALEDLTAAAPNPPPPTTPAPTPTPTIENVRFQFNESTGNGGGLAVRPQGSISLVDASFESNTAAGIGGGLFLSINGVGNLDLTRVTFLANIAVGGSGGAANIGRNGTWVDIIAKGNRAQTWGGAFSIRRDANVTATNVLLTGNVAVTNNGGAIAVRPDPGAPSLTLIKATVHGNYAGGVGGGLWTNGTISLQNSIVWGNNDASANPPHLKEFTNEGTGSATYCLIAGGDTTAWPGSWIADGGNNVSGTPGNNPDFVTPLGMPMGTTILTGDVHLQSGSPALDVGNDAFVAGITQDLDGSDRLVGTVDLGPYERP